MYAKEVEIYDVQWAHLNNYRAIYFDFYRMKMRRLYIHRGNCNAPHLFKLPLFYRKE